MLVLAVLVLFAGCTEAPTAVGGALPILDDVGTGRWTMVTVGRDHSCGLVAGGKAYCWGLNAAGQLGTPRADSICGKTKLFPGLRCMVTPVPVGGDLTFRAISAGGTHSCGLTVDRAIYCWGDNSAGALGVPGADGATPVRVSSALPFVEVSAGNLHTCAVRSDGVVLCWGRNNRRQLAKPDTSPSATPLVVSGGRRFASVSAGEGKTCARSTIGEVLCWGSLWLYRGEDGLEYSRDQPAPIAVPGAPLMTTVSVGTFTSCGTDVNGAAYCWEANPHGEMGSGNTTGSLQPHPVVGGVRFASVSAGIIQTCGLSLTGAAYCWGNNSFGQLGVQASVLAEKCGQQRLACSTAPVAVFGRQTFTSVATGFGNHVCGVTTRGNIYCWGLGYWGQLGTGRSTVRASLPLLVRDPTG